MNIHSLPKQAGYHRKAKRVGRGIGSGKGKTAGRGTKGQKARGTIPAYFEGGGGRRNRLLKRLPYLRGIGNPKRSPKPVLITLQQLGKQEAGEVTLDSLINHRLITRKDAKRKGVKLSGVGEVTTTYTVAIPATKTAREKVERAGGTIATT